MRIRYDHSSDAAYISLVDEKDRLPFGHTYSCDPNEVGGQIHMDFDISGRLIGIEILQASKKLPHSVLKTEDVTPRTDL